MTNDKRQKRFLIVLSLLTLFFAVVGATFAYFTITVRGNEEASSVAIRSAKLGEIVFTDGDTIDAKEIYPGDYVTKTFTVSNTEADSNTKVEYCVYLDQVTNEFGDNNIVDFKHQIIDSSKSSSSSESKLATELSESVTVPSKGSTAPIMCGTLYGNDIHTYTYKIGLTETGVAQNSAQGRTFLGKLRVEVADSEKYTSGGTKWVE